MFSISPCTSDSVVQDKVDFQSFWWEFSFSTLLFFHVPCDYHIPPPNKYLSHILAQILHFSEEKDCIIVVEVENANTFRYQHAKLNVHYRHAIRGL